MKIKNALLCLSIILLIGATTLSMANATIPSCIIDHGWTGGIKNWHDHDILVNVDGVDYIIPPQNPKDPEDSLTVNLNVTSIITYNGITIPALATEESLKQTSTANWDVEKADHLFTIMNVGTGFGPNAIGFNVAYNPHRK